MPTSAPKKKVRAQWEGVIPAITTPFRKDGKLDAAEIARQCRWMVASGCIGIVPCGSLGEGATLTYDEKVELIRICVKAVPGTPIIPGIASLSTAEAVALAKESERLGCGGLMVLPPYVYSTDWREMKAHVSAIIAATKLPCMLYNNPPAYKTDFLPAQIAELAAEHRNLEAVKESSGDSRRVTAIRHLLGDRLTILVGMDDCILEGVAAGWELEDRALEALGHVHVALSVGDQVVAEGAAVAIGQGAEIGNHIQLLSAPGCCPLRFGALDLRRDRAEGKTHHTHQLRPAAAAGAQPFSRCRQPA